MGQVQSNSIPRQMIHKDAFRNDWRYTIRSMPMENRVTTINKNQYHFGKQLGEGAFGSVYAARHLPDKRPVAIKVISIATMHNQEATMIAESFLNEIEMSERLAKTSKHIVHMYDFDFHNHTGLSFIVMELGQHDLEKALLQKHSLSSAERKSIWRQLVDIAVTLHSRQIVHLDIKPSNLVIFPGNIVKLVDLGIAQKAIGKRIGPNGTKPYSAPEVTTVSYFHMTINTTKSDVWSWGAVLYRMTYMVPPDYNPPCYRPPSDQHPARDPHLISVLRHTLVINPKERCDVRWLAEHPYTKTP